MKVNRMFNFILDEIYIAKQKALAEAESCNFFSIKLDKIQKEIESNKLRLTPEFLRYTAIRNLINNTNLYFGENIPSYFTNTFLPGQQSHNY